MIAEVLCIEPYFRPWKLIVTDGRTVNARFFQENMERNWQYPHDSFRNRKIFRLEETPFGPVIHVHLTTRLEVSSR